MAKKDKRVDLYIKNSAKFAQDVLTHYRQLVHASCPDAVEKIKWGFPHFDYLDSPMTHMAAFKQHCAIGFWKAALMVESKELLRTAGEESAMGHLGRITQLSDLPKDAVLKRYIKNAMKLNEEGLKVPRKIKSDSTSSIEVPEYFQKALNKLKPAKTHFEKFSPSCKREYIQWLEEAKTELTRTKRMESALEWISEGKIRNWKYLKK
jgi:uncharacterized protein YdeI (YjbR/CyaY-like superfamily)